MPRTAPAVNGTPVTQNVSFRFIDATGDLRSVAVRLLPAATNAQIEGLASTLGAASNAALYAVEVTSSYGVPPSKAAAVNTIRPSVYDNIVLLFKTAIGFAQNIFIPAPIEASFETGTDVPDPNAVTTAGVINTGLAALNAGGGTYTPVSVRFTERREINERVII